MAKSRSRSATLVNTKRPRTKLRVVIPSKKKSVGTQTRRFKKKKLNGRPKHTGTGHWLSFGRGVFNKKPQRFIKKMETLLGEQHEQYNTVVQVIPGAGLQAVANIASAYTIYDIMTYGGGFTTTAPQKVILKDYAYNIMMTNNSNAPVFVDLYDVVCRRDSIDHDATISSPIGSWQADVSGTSGNTTYYGITPFASPSFCCNWKVLKVTRLNLALGETAEHVVKGRINKLWNHAIDSQQYLSLGAAPTAVQGCLKGLTTYTFAVIKGCPTDATNGTVGSSNAKIDFISTIRYTVQQVQVNGSSWTGAASNIATVAGDIMDTGTGASAAVTSA